MKFFTWLFGTNDSLHRHLEAAKTARSTSESIRSVIEKRRVVLRRNFSPLAIVEIDVKTVGIYSTYPEYVLYQGEYFMQTADNPDYHCVDKPVIFEVS